MKSIAWETRERGKLDLLGRSVSENVVGYSGAMADLQDASQTPEGAIIKKEEEEFAAEIVTELEALFADDDHAQLILMGEMDKLAAEEIRELGGMDKTTYASARRRMRRKIDQHYPNGWGK